MAYGTVRSLLRGVAATAALLLLVVPGASAAGSSAGGKQLPNNLGGSCPTFGCVAPQLAQSTELISNGGFEYFSGGWWPTPIGWTLTAGAVINNDSARAHSGSNFLDFGTIDGTATQSFTIPAGTTEADFSFWYSVWPGSSIWPGVYDYAHVDLFDARTGVILRRYLASSQYPTTGWMQVGPCNLAAYAGRTIQLKFDASFQQTVPADFSFDDVSVRLPGVQLISIPPKAC